jgi:site-specific DNA-cytosine methylase
VQQTQSRRASADPSTADAEAVTAAPVSSLRLAETRLPDAAWSASVALDPKHRPQAASRPSSTVRREWCRFPQEAHLLDEANDRYRRLTVDEMARLQGFEPSWFDVPGVSPRNRVRAIGDAVPPALAAAVFRGVLRNTTIANATALEVCAGSGGLSLGLALAEPSVRHVALVDRWSPSVEILRHSGPWHAEVVTHADVRDVDFASFAGEVGVLYGGPPCQPWSMAGRGLGLDDDRDLLASVHEIVDMVRPEVFVFENVPGLAYRENSSYLGSIIDRLRHMPSGLRYGVIAGVLNAADFGVPQVRRRVFIIGIRDRLAADAFRVLDRIHASSTHRDPLLSDASRSPWRTVGDVIASDPDPGGWRRWGFSELSER